MWAHGALHPLGRARFGFGRDDSLGLWRMESETGDFALRFRPLHVHKEERNLGLVRSRFWQLQGFFTGTVRAGGEVLELNGLPGVTEDQARETLRRQAFKLPLKTRMIKREALIA